MTHKTKIMNELGTDNSIAGRATRMPAFSGIKLEIECAGLLLDGELICRS